MNLIKLAMEKVFGKGQSKAALARRMKREHGYDAGTRNIQAGVSRQAQRAAERDAQYALVAVSPYAVGNKREAILPRKLRRQIARNKAKQAWRNATVKADAAAA